MALFFLGACDYGGDSHIVVFDEKLNEVFLTDFSSLHFALRCRIDSKSKNCGIILGDFLLEDSRMSGCSPNTGCDYYETYYGFKEASLLTLQVKNEDCFEAYYSLNSLYSLN